MKKLSVALMVLLLSILLVPVSLGNVTQRKHRRKIIGGGAMVGGRSVHGRPRHVGAIGAGGAGTYVMRNRSIRRRRGR